MLFLCWDYVNYLVVADWKWPLLNPRLRMPFPPIERLESPCSCSWGSSCCLLPVSLPPCAQTEHFCFSKNDFSYTIFVLFNYCDLTIFLLWSFCHCLYKTRTNRNILNIQCDACFLHHLSGSGHVSNHLRGKACKKLAKGTLPVSRMSGGLV